MAVQSPVPGQLSPAVAAGTWCTSSAESTATDRVNLSAGLPSLFDGVDFKKLSTAAAGDLAIRVLQASGPLPAAVAAHNGGATIRRWVTDTFPPGTDTAYSFLSALTTAYHETLHGVQGAASCLPTGALTGLSSAGMHDLGPLQSETHTDVVARVNLLVGSTSSCARWAPSVAGTYLTGSMGDQRLWSQMVEINAYVTELELSMAWDSAFRSRLGSMWVSNTSTALVKMHQVARYLELARATPGTWDQFRAKGTDSFLRWTYNLLAATARPVGNGMQTDFRDCWTLAFGTDAQSIKDFVSTAGTLDDPAVKTADATTRPTSGGTTVTTTLPPSSPQPVATVRVRRGTSLSKNRLASILGVAPSAVRVIARDGRDRARCTASASRVRTVRRGTCRIVVTVSSGATFTKRRITATVT